MSNFGGDNEWTGTIGALFLHILQYFSRFCEVFGGRDLYPLVRKNRLKTDAEGLSSAERYGTLLVI